MRKRIPPLLKAVWKSHDMTYYEGILGTSNDWPNFAAVGAEITGSKIGGRLYLPSDTGTRLVEGKSFSFSLTDNPNIFFKAALTGHNKKNQQELGDDEFIQKNGYVYPTQASKVYLCKTKKTKIVRRTDRYGEAKIKLFEGEILEKIIECEEYLSREDPCLDALVYATRLPLADNEQKQELIREIDKILNKIKKNSKQEDKKTKEKILDFVEEWS